MKINIKKTGLKKKIVDYFIRKNFDVSYIVLLLARLKKMQIKKVVWLDEVDEKHSIDTVQNAKICSVSPNFNGIQNEIINYDYLYLYSLKDVIANVHSSSFASIYLNKIYIERVNTADIKYCNYSAGIVQGHNTEKALIKKNNKFKCLNNVFFMGGNGAFNYYHWLIEIAPKILFLDSKLIDGLDFIVVSSDVKKIKSFEVILNVFLRYKKIDLPILFVDPNIDLKISNLFFINTFNNVVFNSVEKLSDVSFSHYHVESLKKVREILISELGVSELKNTSKKIFLARGSDKVRGYNQNEIIDFFKKENFQIIYLEQLSFKDQIELFYNADFIVGPSGAAWANIIFCKNNSKAISWLPENIREFSVFSSLASIFNCDMHFVEAETHSDLGIHSSYTIDLKLLREKYLLLN